MYKQIQKNTMANPWQLSCESLSERYGTLLDSGEWTDCTFLLGPSQTMVRAHRVILAAASPPLAAALLGPMADGAPVSLPDVDERAFRLMLCYIYSDYVEISSFDEALDLVYVSHKYLLRGLTRLSVNTIERLLEPSNALMAYETGVLFNETELKDAAAKIIQDKTQEVLSSPSFVQAQPETVSAMFAMDPLSIDNEVPLLQAVERYIVARPDVDQVNKRSVTVKLLEHIRILTLWPEEWEPLAGGRSFLNDLDLDLAAVTARIADPDCNVQLPSELSDCRTMRQNRRLPIRSTPPESSVTFKISAIKEIYHKKASWFSYEYTDQPKRVGNYSVELTLEHWEDFEDEASFMVICGKDKWNPRPELEITLLNHGDRSRPIVWIGEKLIDEHPDFWSWLAGVPWKELLDPRKGYVVDDSIYIKVDVLRTL